VTGPRRMRYLAVPSAVASSNALRIQLMNLIGSPPTRAPTRMQLRTTSDFLPRHEPRTTRDPSLRQGPHRSSRGVPVHHVAEATILSFSKSQTSTWTMGSRDNSRKRFRASVSVLTRSMRDRLITIMNNAITSFHCGRGPVAFREGPRSHYAASATTFTFATRGLRAAAFASTFCCFRN
jgi:hypothetical protein